VLTCYLDDSGKDPQNLVTTIAGYIARDDAWQSYEEAVEPILSEYGVSILHAKDLRDTVGNFAGWSGIKKQSFVARICMARSGRLTMGLSMSTLKHMYKQRAYESNRKRTVTPYTFCLNVIVEWLLTDIRIGGAVHSDGLALVLECGHENNPEAQEQFNDIRERHKLHDVLRSISFVPKEACIAIQLAGLFAFYSRRDSNSMIRAKNRGKSVYEVDFMLKIITSDLPHRGLVANDFDAGAKGSPFFPFGKPIS
jgi:hypothetical protein